jgi:hypothetical protein
METVNSPNADCYSQKGIMSDRQVRYCKKKQPSAEEEEGFHGVDKNHSKTLTKLMQYNLERVHN